MLLAVREARRKELSLLHNFNSNCKYFFSFGLDDLKSQYCINLKILYTFEKITKKVDNVSNDSDLLFCLCSSFSLTLMENFEY